MAPLGAQQPKDQKDGLLDARQKLGAWPTALGCWLAGPLLSGLSYACN